MNSSSHINHNAVLRARVALLASWELLAKEEVAAYRVLVDVSPLAYLPRLAVALREYSRQEFSGDPRTALALHAESVAAARRMCALEPERTDLLVDALVHYRERLVLMGRHAEVPAVDREISLAGGSADSA
ncbi:MULTISPECIES: hypothetical protein [unclassified Streptomyces]|uniref:hypothetical protein n=1 Tax=unclassified Streptomyces TaxID=2593676 RepID=UPI000DC7AF85|nr:MULTISPECIES: hypothetical protein [unclassified Streptomyces]AWZ06755.1 hypothetical protein DRB89_21410 [Streptomyces sp. ICC4]AWZ15450.1 hypothetical protein DRB96_27865 [Streptomyces sp. ICC1]